MTCFGFFEKDHVTLVGVKKEKEMVVATIKKWRKSIQIIDPKNLSTKQLRKTKFRAIRAIRQSYHDTELN